MEDSVNFDSNKSVRKFADILAIAPVLKKCDFRGQQGNKKVKVEVKYSFKKKKGAIVIWEIDDDGQIIGEQ